MRVFGTIEDAYTEKPLAGALVTLGVGDTELVEHMPTEDGYFEYEIADEAIPVDQEILTCTVEKKGYKTLTATYTITDEIEVAIELVPRLVNWKRIFIVTGIVLGSLLLLAIIFFAIKYFFFGPKEYPIKTFTIKPAKIKAGEKAEIKWETIDADVVFLGKEKVEKDDQVELNGTQTVSPGITRKYFLTVQDDDGKQLAREWRELKIIPPPPVILSFTAKPMEINLWESAVLEWKTIGAETIYIRCDPKNENFRIEPRKVQKERSIIDKDDPGTETREPEKNKKELNGAVEVSPLETTTFTITAVNSEGVKSEESVEVRVLVPPQILSFITNADIIEPGESAILTWDTRESEQVLLNGERTAPRFSQEVRPQDTTVYTLTARNKTGERNCALTITVRCSQLPDVIESPPLKPPRIYRFHISSTSIAPGESTMLTWLTDHAEKVYLTITPVELIQPSPEAIAITGEKPEDPGTGTAASEEIIAGKPLETGEVIRVKSVDTLRVSPRVSTRYQLQAINPLKTLSWTRTVEVKPTTCTVILYELENYKGEFIQFTSDAAEIDKLDNRVSSIMIIGNCGVKVFSAPNFRATHQEFPSSVPRLRGTWIGNNTISSFKIINYQGVGK
jgi:uncharacterized cupredoxin-like copper-binding protein